MYALLYALLPCPTFMPYFFMPQEVGHEVGHGCGQLGHDCGGHDALLSCPTFHVLLLGKVGHGPKHNFD